ncbi:hypothetical protein [Ectothiorhodospira lacustris]|uniref:hypothetical protein n=1 Tax=Ectothiorhodospira lacustris TaxID=2899127 RepID=UPI001EE8626C|nr:hypothetical protein [Ectothiorhodospira lacustris]MCG5501015.1 hypothetical protein [Ectothiorhodospira lacustris]MCG5510567.1 hypothetical protein [Ectothiorhodospira lacustris]MCG5521259.1 hypothetical protein [Ectothiorhodospira lacustris]
MTRIIKNMNRLMTLAFKALESQARRTPEAGNPVVEAVTRACRQGDFGSARLNFLKLAQQSQIGVLQTMDEQAIRRLALGLPDATLARLCAQGPAPLSETIARSLPEGRRRGVSLMSERHRRHQA